MFVSVYCKAYAARRAICCEAVGRLGCRCLLRGLSFALLSYLSKYAATVVVIVDLVFFHAGGDAVRRSFAVLTAVVSAFRLGVRHAETPYNICCAFFIVADWTRPARLGSRPEEVQLRGTGRTGEPSQQPIKASARDSLASRHPFLHAARNLRRRKSVARQLLFAGSYYLFPFLG